MLKFKCKLNLHQWTYETKGHLHDGFIYPIRVRTCKDCGVKQVEVIDDTNKQPDWKVSDSA